ncbi:hypothetical protein AAMO2058_001299600 [Amorphochlora amoebiformis]
MTRAAVYLVLVGIFAVYYVFSDTYVLPRSLTTDLVVSTSSILDNRDISEESRKRKSLAKTKDWGIERTLGRTLGIKEVVREQGQGANCSMNWKQVAKGTGDPALKRFRIVKGSLRCIVSTSPPHVQVLFELEEDLIGPVINAMKTTKSVNTTQNTPNPIASWVLFGDRRASRVPGTRIRIPRVQTGGIVSYQAGKIETNAAISSNKRLYLATLRVFEEGVYALKLVYRKRDVLYVPPNRVSEIIRDKKNKINNTWVEKIPKEDYDRLELHFDHLYEGLQLKVNINEDSPLKPSEDLPLCPIVQTISKIGRFIDTEWVPGNCRMARFTRKDTPKKTWKFLPPSMNWRLTGDSNYQHLTHMLQGHLFDSYPRDQPDSDAVFRINNETVSWRFFRGMVSGDRLSPYVMPSLIHKTDIGNKCLGFFEANDKHNYTHYTINAGLWPLAFMPEDFVQNWGAGLRRILLDCQENHKQFRKRVKIFWVETTATFYSPGPGNAWRNSYNGRILRWEESIQMSIKDLVDGIIPAHGITLKDMWDSAGRVSGDGIHHSMVPYMEMFQLVLNEAARLYQLQKRQI